MRMKRATRIGVVVVVAVCGLAACVVWLITYAAIIAPFIPLPKPTRAVPPAAQCAPSGWIETSECGAYSIVYGPVTLESTTGERIEVARGEVCTLP